jgi:hypothetical protein
MQAYLGGRHCGALQFRYATALLPVQWEVRACQCSFCRAHGGLTTDPAGTLSLTSTDESVLQRYRFGTGITEFWICRRCGMYIAATMEGFGVINVRALHSVPPDLPEPIPMQYGEESREGRRERRVARWTALTAPTR